MGEAAVAEAAAKEETERLQDEKRNTPMRTYAEAHAKYRTKAVTANVGTLVLAGKWAERGRLLVRRKPEMLTATIDATRSQDNRRRDGGSGRHQELFVVCPPDQRAGSVVTVITADGSTVDVIVPYGIMP